MVWVCAGKHFVLSEAGSLHCGSGLLWSQSDAEYVLPHKALSPSVSFPSWSSSTAGPFIITLTRCGRNLSLAYTNSPVVDQFRYKSFSLKLQNLWTIFKWGLTVLSKHLASQSVASWELSAATCWLVFLEVFLFFSLKLQVPEETSSIHLTNLARVHFEGWALVWTPRTQQWARQAEPSLSWCAVRVGHPAQSGSCWFLGHCKRGAFTFD